MLDGGRSLLITDYTNIKNDLVCKLNEHISFIQSNLSKIDKYLTEVTITAEKIIDELN